MMPATMKQKQQQQMKKKREKKKKMGTWNRDCALCYDPRQGNLV